MESPPSYAGHRATIVAKLKRAASLPRMKNGRRPPMHEEAASEGEQEERPDKESELGSESDRGEAVKNANAGVFNQCGEEVAAGECIEDKREGESSPEQSVTPVLRKRRSRARTRRFRDMKRLRDNAAGSPGDEYAADQPSVTPSPPVVSSTPLRAQSLASHLPYPAVPRRSSLTSLPTSPSRLPTLEDIRNSLVNPASIIAMQKLTGSVEPVNGSLAPLSCTPPRNSDTVVAGERMEARRNLLRRLGGRLEKADTDITSGEELDRPATSRTPKRRRQSKRKRDSSRSSSCVDDTEDQSQYHTSMNTPFARPSPLSSPSALAIEPPRLPQSSNVPPTVSTGSPLTDVTVPLFVSGLESRGYRHDTILSRYKPYGDEDENSDQFSRISDPGSVRLHERLPVNDDEDEGSDWVSWVASSPPSRMPVPDDGSDEDEDENENEKVDELLVEIEAVGGDEQGTTWVIESELLGNPPFPAGDSKYTDPEFFPFPSTGQLEELLNWPEFVVGSSSSPDARLSGTTEAASSSSSSLSSTTGPSQVTHQRELSRGASGTGLSNGPSIVNAGSSKLPMNREGVKKWLLAKKLFASQPSAPATAVTSSDDGKLRASSKKPSLSELREAVVRRKDSHLLSDCADIGSDKAKASAATPSQTHAQTGAKELTEEDPDRYMLSIIEHLLSADLAVNGHSLEALRQCQQSPSPYRDLIQLCVACSTETEELSDMVLCAMQESYDSLVHQSDPSGRGKFIRRMLIKASQKMGAVPSSLFVQGVSFEGVNRPEGMGGFADVFRGTKGGCDVALKRLRIASYLVAEYEWKRPFYREALLWRQLRHENILQFIGLDKQTFDGCICMVSPWMANGDIARYLVTHEEKATRPLKYKWILQIMAGLGYLHDQGVIHGDFRGANILLNDTLNAQIADFGLSMLTDAGMSTMGVTTMHEGAVRWTAPEVIDSGKCTTEGDMYSFGCVCLEIFSRTCPLPDLKNDKQVIRQVGLGRRPEWCVMHQSDAHIVDALGNLVRACWLDDPASRPGMHNLVQRISSSINASDDSCVSDSEAASQLWRLLSPLYND